MAESRGICFKTLTGKEITVRVSPGELTNVVRTKVAGLLGWTSSDVCLVYNGTTALDDATKLYDLPIDCNFIYALNKPKARRTPDVLDNTFIDEATKHEATKHEATKHEAAKDNVPTSLGNHE
jgi:hypothetical protein